MVLEPVEDDGEAIALGGPGAGDGGDTGVAADADQARCACSVVRLDRLDLGMLGEEAAALLERHLVAQRLADVAQRRAWNPEESVAYREQMLADLLELGGR